MGRDGTAPRGQGTVQLRYHAPFAGSLALAPFLLTHAAMTWPPLALVFLGTIALASLVQTALLIGCAVALLRAQARAQAELAPHLERAAEITSRLHELSEAAARQVPELESTVRDAARRVRNAGEVAEKTLVRPLAAAAMLFAVYRAFRRVAGPPERG